jgi:hypothetical protein
MTWPGLEPWRRGGQQATNHVGYRTDKNSELPVACLINKKKKKRVAMSSVV